MEKTDIWPQRLGWLIKQIWVMATTTGVHHSDASLLMCELRAFPASLFTGKERDSESSLDLMGSETLWVVAWALHVARSDLHRTTQTN